MKSAVLVPVILLMTIMMVGCAPAANQLARPPEMGEDVAGFWSGLWHGLIMPVTFVISLFSNRVGMYEVVNSGHWYDLGFLFGAMITLGGGSGGASRRGRRER